MTTQQNDIDDTSMAEQGEVPFDEQQTAIEDASVPARRTSRPTTARRSSTPRA